MAVLSDPDRVDVWGDWMRDVSADHESCGITKADLQAAVNAADSWANSNASVYNLALPTAARNNLTSAQKARLLMYVVRKRWLSGA